MYDNLLLSQINPYIRLVNNYGGSYAYVQPERIIYDYEMMYVLDGSITIFYDKQKYELHRSDLLLFRPGVVNHMEISEGACLKTHCIHFDWVQPEQDENFSAEDHYMNSILSKECQKQIPLLKKRNTPEPADFQIPTYLHNLDYTVFSELFSKCYFSFITKTEISSLQTKSIFMEIIIELYKHLQADNTQLEHPKVQHAVAFIKDHYAEPLSVADLADQFNLSPKYFGTIFKNTTGMSVNAFIHSLRILDAKQMLLGSSLSISEIAYTLGYSNEFYFSNKFKEAEGVSPKRYRDTVTG